MIFLFFLSQKYIYSDSFFISNYIIHTIAVVSIALCIYIYQQRKEKKTQYNMKHFQLSSAFILFCV